MEERPAWLSFAAPALVAAVLLLAKLPTLGDPYYWDALGCYLPQARAMAAGGLDLDGYRGMPFVRPPVALAPAAALLRLGAGRPALHLYLCLFGLGVLGTYGIARSLGAGRRTATLGAVLCAVTPAYFAQAGLVQLDLPAAALCALAWAALLRGRTALYAALGAAAVLTKESSYFLCVPAALLLARRQAGSWGGVLSPRAVLRALPAAAPALALIGWLLLHRRLTGRYVAADHTDALFSAGHVAAALLHSFIEGGRLWLVLAAVLAVRAGWRRPEVLTTAAAVVAMPLCFAGLPPRYMLPSLPPLCALAALGLGQLPLQQRLGAAALLLGALCFGWRGDSWHANSGEHLEANMAYRERLSLHREAAVVIAARRPRAVIAGFPMASVLFAPPEDGFLSAPLAADPGEAGDLAALCAHDLLVDAPGTSLDRPRRILEARGALVPWRVIGPAGGVGDRRLTPPWARVDHRIRIYEIRCPPSVREGEGAP